MSIESRAREIAEFLNIPEAEAIARLSRGFGALHADVNDDFRRVNPQTDDELLEWYRTTEAYIWELSAYHEDPGFNYSGMCEGIAVRLRNDIPGGKVLCLGDGVGDLTLTLIKHGLRAVYHDLAGSKTSEFAHRKVFESVTTSDGRPSAIANNAFVPFDAVVSLDFLEHCTDVPRYVKAIYDALRPGGLGCFQNAFDCGSGPDGSIPCHLAINDKYAHATPETGGLALWDHLLFGIGFKQLSSNWYQRPA